jgi:hypothetical protein
MKNVSTAPRKVYDNSKKNRENTVLYDKKAWKVPFDGGTLVDVKYPENDNTKVVVTLVNKNEEGKFVAGGEQVVCEQE